MNASGPSWERLEPLLEQVLDLPAHTRPAWLRRHCADAALRDEVTAILAADTARGAQIDALASSDNPWAIAEAALPFAMPEVPGYRILSLLGEGGMASVFLAERTVSGTVQQVALKRLRLSVHDLVERRRFEAEQRILARLEHSGIARFIDAGIARDGVPWYAMEYVEGQELIEWCDARRIGIDQRLALFVDICQAVHYAHQHLVIHRDIKPSNILVDEEGRIKLLDFGVAKLLDPDTGRPDATRTEHRRLTPAYAAPEQFDGKVSTASDVYALGVLLTELVSGSRPAVATVTAQDRFGKIVIGSREAAVRDTSPQALSKLLARDVGMIARKAMRMEPEQRYGSALGMAEDIEAWRQGRPVDARRGDWTYRAGCFVRRHLTAVAAAAVLILILLGATIFSLRQANRANTQAEISSTVQRVMEGMLGPLYESLPPDQAPKLEVLVSNSVAKLADGDEHKPAVQAELLAMFARTYQRIHNSERALELAKRSYDFNLASFGADDPRSVRALAFRGSAKFFTDDADGARQDLERARAAMRRIGDTGREYIEAGDTLAFLMQDLDGGESGLDLLKQSLVERIAQFGPASLETAEGHTALGFMHQRLRQYAQSIVSHRMAHEIYLQHGDLRRAAESLSSVGWTECWTGNCNKGAEDMEAVLALFGQIKGKEHPVPQWVFDRVCVMHLIIDNLERAEQTCAKAVELARLFYDPDSNLRARAVAHLAKVRVQQGRLSEARTIMHEVRDRLVAAGAPDVDIWYIDRVLSDQQLISGEYEAMRDGLLPPILANAFPGQPMVPLMMARLALACHYAPSEKCPRDLIERVDRDLAKPHRADGPHFTALLPLVRLALAQGKPREALRRLGQIEQGAARPDSNVSANHRYMKVAAMFRGEAQAALGKHAEALRNLKIAETDFAERFPADHPFRLRVAADLRQLQSGYRRKHGD